MDLVSKIKEYFTYVNNITQIITIENIERIISRITQIPLLCELDLKSARFRRQRDIHPKKYHPIKVYKGEVYNAKITENVGSELSSNHLVIIVQGFSSNVYGEKVTVLPIEGDGGRINPQVQN